MKRLNIKFIFYYLTLYILISLIYFNFQNITNHFDNNLREHFFEIRGKIPTTNNVVIVDINEESLKQLGQWPFGRDKMAQTLINLTNAQVGIIGLDIIFAENDRVSPHAMAKQLNIKGDFLNHDTLLGNVVANTPTILGYFFTINESNDNLAPKIPQNIIAPKNNHLIEARGVYTNIKEVQQNSYSSGFFNAFSNPTGKMTHMPLLLRYQNRVYPSLSFELIRIASQTKKTNLEYEKNKLIGIQLDNFFIPTDSKGFFNINFRGPQKSFKYISFLDIYNNNFKEEDIAGKIVLIGSTIPTLADLRATTYDLAMPGVEIHANIIDNILKQDFLYKPTWSVALDVLLILSLTLILGYILIIIKPLFILPFIIAFTSGLYFYFYNLLFIDGIIINLFFPLVCIISTTLLTTLLKYLQERNLSLFIKDKFAKKVSTAVMEDLLQRKDDTFKIKNCELSIFFSDLRDFTKISETINDPEKLIQLLNKYMDPMTKSIIEEKGTIDKFIGDAIMAYWNAPLSTKNHADAALRAALKQLMRLKELNKHIKEEYNFELDIGIGINSGLCTVGEMGSTGRSDYTIIGDNVNLASRVEGLTKYFGVKLIITEQTKKLLTQEYKIKELATVKVKGKEEPTILYEVIGFENTKSEHDLLHEEALSFYKNGNLTKALDIFTTLDKKSSTNLTQLYINSCKKSLDNPSKNFTPIFDLDFK